jgi:hypothetical protein
MSRWAAFGAALCGWSLSAAAGAQSPLQACAVGPPAFATTEANRLNCQAIDALRAKQALIFQRQHRQHAGCELRYTVPPDRGDGSFVVLCEVRCLGRHDWQACQSGGELPGRTTGVGTCADGVVCTRALGIRAGGESCVSYHREGGRFAVAWVRGGRSCAEGDVAFVDR